MTKNTIFDPIQKWTETNIQSFPEGDIPYTNWGLSGDDPEPVDDPALACSSMCLGINCNLVDILPNTFYSGKYTKKLDHFLIRLYRCSFLFYFICLPLWTPLYVFPADRGRNLNIVICFNGPAIWMSGLKMGFLNCPQTSSWKTTSCTDQLNYICQVECKPFVLRNLLKRINKFCIMKVKKLCLKK